LIISLVLIQVCCCVGGHQKQKLIDSMLAANMALAKEIKRLEAEDKRMKTQIFQLGKTIDQGNKAFALLKGEKEDLEKVVEHQRKQIADW